MVVVHSNPLIEPGVGDAGGMTVYVREVARSLAARGAEVDVFTRRDSEGLPITELTEGVRVIQVDAGSPDLPKEDLPTYLPEFTARLMAMAGADGARYDIIHSHYWLSGRVAAKLSDRWGIPFVHTFHTLGRVKNGRLRLGEQPESRGRLCGEARTIADADAIVASTPDELDSLTTLYSAHPERIHLIPPGVDHSVFSPGDPDGSRARLASRGIEGLAGRKVVAFVGRLQPLKSADDAINAVAELISTGRFRDGELRLLIVGGPSGPGGAAEPQRLRALAERLGVGSSVVLIDAQPHTCLPDFYRSADAVLVPSRSESFGLVALEAQASGVPVVASRVGGLRWIVKHESTGLLVDPGDPKAIAEGVWKILSDEALAESMRRSAIASSEEFSWDRSAEELVVLYDFIRGADGRSIQSAKKLLESRRNLAARH